MKILKGEFINGSAVVYKKKNGRLVQGLQYRDGSFKWFNYKWIHHYFDDRARVISDNGIGYIDRIGEECIKAVFDSASDFSERRALVCKDETTSLINIDGVVLKEWNGIFEASQFVNGIAAIRKISKENNNPEVLVIDREGNIVETPKKIFSKKNTKDLLHDVQLESWHEGIIRFYDDGFLCVLDYSGHQLKSDFKD
ncbi:MAG: WG repeat-containing protein [Ignavibacteriaceae bacterium]|nr:WG repeat-containing protein [Ignavibacteriaceae bacterium]